MYLPGNRQGGARLLLAEKEAGAQIRTGRKPWGPVAREAPLQGLTDGPWLVSDSLRDALRGGYGDNGWVQGLPSCSTAPLPGRMKPPSKHPSFLSGFKISWYQTEGPS